LEKYVKTEDKEGAFRWLLQEQVMKKLWWVLLVQYLDILSRFIQGVHKIMVGC
jgi:hypothetical protein